MLLDVIDLLDVRLHDPEASSRQFTDTAQTADYTGMPQLKEELDSLAGLSAWGLNCLDVESSQEIIERGVLKHLINIDLLEGHSRLKLHEHVVCQGI